MGTTFLDYLSTHFLICNEMIKGKGEDCGLELYTEETGLIGAFDGCGGLGSKSCPNLSNSTEAYIAARAIYASVKQWFYNNCSSGYEWSPDKLKEIILSKLKVCQDHAGGEIMKFRGSLVRPFPSTLSLVTFQIRENALVTEHIWAGDSRSYYLNREGLSQISVDDIRNEDAMSNLSRDGALTNVISVDGRFELHKTQFVTKDPCILVCATDGCFGYVSSPMEFEFMLLSSLIRADSVAQWRSLLDGEIASRAGDDQTIAIAAFGYESFHEMKSDYMQRYNEMLEFMKTFNSSDKQTKQKMWELYKPSYYRIRSRR